jgi:C-terminal processing protease CtpA/Prc
MFGGFTNSLMSFSEFIRTDGLSRIKIRDLLSGDIGTPVVLRLERQGKTVNVGLVRGLARIDTDRQPSPENEAPSTQVGLGLAIEIAEEGCTVLNTVVGGGAHSCRKISTGDLLIAVLDRSRSTDFVPTIGLDLNQVRNMIIGAPGSKVTLKMQQSRSKPQPKAAPPAVASPANPAPAPVRAPLPPPSRNGSPRIDTVVVGLPQ